ncbi:MAG: sulfatase-like hydrolase/transferase, partial [Candidatus Aminicenantes bacterium]
MADKSSVSRPNILFVFTDQQRWDTAGCYGNPMDLTPNLDAIAQRGVLFENAFSCQPVCAPARGCLQTGKYATQHTVWRNGLVLPEHEETLAHDFKGQGYRTGYIGKWHLANTRTEPVPVNMRGGYEHWEASDVLEFTSHPYDTKVFDVNNQPIKVPGYRVNAITELVIRFLRQQENEPFFLFLSYIEPHHQNDMKRYVAPDGYAEKYADYYVPPDLEGHEGDWKENLPDYYGIVARIDECLGQILGELDRLGMTERTIVFFTSDHGSHFRTRNREYKRSCHESSIRVPMAAQGPGFSGGKVVSELISLMNVPPTLLDAAGIPVPERMQERSAMPLVKGEDVDWDKEVFIQISESQVGRAIRTDRWKYCVDAPDKNGGRDPASDVYVEQYQYDLKNDPYERNNLVGQQEYREVADELRETLIRRTVAAG